MLKRSSPSSLCWSGRGRSVSNSWDEMFIDSDCWATGRKRSRSGAGFFKKNKRQLIWIPSNSWGRDLPAILFES